MSNNDSQELPGVLYVDDETKALKYFDMAFNKQYRIFTAEGGKAGLEILEAHHSEITIVVSDQRMPEMAGVDFLTKVRSYYPDKTRILTTAYSDLDSAIRSVNEGKIYQYVTKPWDLQDFKMVLKRAHDYQNILSERDHLMALKMSTLQRIILADRLKTLAGLADSGCIKQPATLITTLVCMIQHLPHGFDLNPASGGVAMLQHGLAVFMKQERSATAGILKVWQESDLKLEPCIAALRQTAVAQPGAEPMELSVEDQDDCLVIRFPLGELNPQQLLPRFLGILCEASPSSFALAFFQLLAAAQLTGKSVKVSPDGLSDANDLLSFSASPNEQAGFLEEILSELYDRWDSSMLGR